MKRDVCAPIHAHAHAVGSPHTKIHYYRTGNALLECISKCKCNAMQCEMDKRQKEK